MAHLVEPWMDLENNGFSAPLESILPPYSEINKANALDSDTNFITTSKSRNNYLFPWKFVTLQTLILRGKAEHEGDFSIDVDKGKLLFGYKFKFKATDKYLPIGDVIVLVPSNSTETIQNPKFQQNIVVPLIWNDEKYSKPLTLVRGTSLFPEITSNCPSGAGQILVPRQSSLSKDLLGVGAVFMYPETPENKKDVRYYAAVKTSWLKIKDQQGKFSPIWSLGKAQCPNQNTSFWFNTPFNTFWVTSSNSNFILERPQVYGFNIDTSMKVPVIKEEKETDKPSRPPSAQPKSYTWIWILIGIILVVSLFVFLYLLEPL